MKRSPDKSSNSLESSTGDLWTVAEVASFLRVSRSWVYHRVGDNKIPCVRIGSLLRFVPDEIRTWAKGEVSGDANEPR